MGFLDDTGLQHFVDGFKQKFAQKLTNTVTISSWTAAGDYYTATVAVSGITASCTVVVSPAVDSVETWAKNSIFCTAQAAGTLTFRSDAAVTVNAHILNLG